MGVRSVKPPIRATTATTGRQGRQLCDKYTLLVGQELTIFQSLLAFDISPMLCPDHECGTGIRLHGNNKRYHTVGRDFTGVAVYIYEPGRNTSLAICVRGYSV